MDDSAYSFKPASKKQATFLKSSAQIVVYGGSMGGGKALRHGMPVLTSAGFKNIEDLVVGDFVVTPTEGVQEVTGVYPQGIVDIYRVTFQDGGWVDVCGEHLWEVRQAMSKKSQVVNTLHVKEMLDVASKAPPGARKWPLIPLCGEIPYSEKDLPLDPYVLGVILGDGGMTGLSTILSTGDSFIVQKFEESGFSPKKLKCGKHDYYVPGLSKITSSLGVRVKSQFKEIPELYFNSSVDQRYSLLQGLMDSDGTVSKDGKCYFSSTSSELSRGVVELVRSLGGTATVSCKSKFYTYKGVRREGLPCYEVYIRHPNPKKLFLLPRKKDLAPESKDISNRVLSVEKVGEDYATCISISGQRKLFITKDYIVTHNTYNGLLKHLMHVGNPHYRGLVIRKSSTTIMKSGFIFDEAMGLFKAFEPKVQVKRKLQKFVFPSGAEVVFTHLATDEDAENLRGGQFSLAMCDESTELQEDHVWRVFSRIRSKAEIPPQLVLTCNPNPDSFLREWIDWWLLPEGHPHAGRADPEKDCKIRWFLRLSNCMVWADTREELIELHGNPDLHHDHEDQVRPISFQFVSATIYDNPPLMKANPMYLANLLALKDVQKERDLFGNWNIREDVSNFYQREWVEEILEEPDDDEFDAIVRAYDLAGSLPSDSYPNPDYFASVKMGRRREDKTYVVLDSFKTRVQPGNWVPVILDYASRDGPNVTINLPIDPGAAGKMATGMLVSEITAHGYSVSTQRPHGKKIDRFRPFSAACQNGLVKIVKNSSDNLWDKVFNDNNVYHSELERFDGSRGIKDDLVDASADAFMYLASQYVLKTNFMSGLTDMYNSGNTINSLIDINLNRG